MHIGDDAEARSAPATQKGIFGVAGARFFLAAKRVRLIDKKMRSNSTRTTSASPIHAGPLRDSGPHAAEQLGGGVTGETLKGSTP